MDFARLDETVQKLEESIGNINLISLPTHFMILYGTTSAIGIWKL